MQIASNQEPRRKNGPKTEAAAQLQKTRAQLKHLAIRRARHQQIMSLVPPTPEWPYSHIYSARDKTSAGASWSRPSANGKLGLTISFLGQLFPNSFSCQKKEVRKELTERDLHGKKYGITFTLYL